MDPTHRETQSPPPSATSSNGSGRSFFMPLSNHGMPKAPLPMSPDGSIRSHRFGSLRSPRSSRSSGPGSSPISPPMSTPISPLMSPQSFGTFIDSAPSSPALSPRQPSSQWGGSTLHLLSPGQPAPKSPMDTSPIEPEWEMIVPGRRNSEPSVKTEPRLRSESPPPRSDRQLKRESPSKPESRPQVESCPRCDSCRKLESLPNSESYGRLEPSPTPELYRKLESSPNPESYQRLESSPKPESYRKLAYHPEPRPPSHRESSSKSDPQPDPEPVPYTIPKPWYPTKREDLEKENQPPSNDSHSHSDAFGKLAKRVKSILRRGNASEKKVVKQQKRRRHEVDRMEDVHWSEM